MGLTEKICANLTLLDLSELKWVVFDECDKIKDDSLNLFKQILNTFSKNNVKANVMYYLIIVLDYFGHRLEKTISLVYSGKFDHSQCN